MSIGAVIAALQVQFPALTVSKLRFLEEQGLVSPSRSASGYRQFSQSDVERLRFALTAQRDSYLPLRLIRDQLADLDAGRPVTGAPGTRVVARDGELITPPRGARVRTEEIAELTGASIAEVQDIADSGVIVADARGRFPGRAVQVVQAVRELDRLGVAPRNLRSARVFAERQADTVSQVVAPLQAQRTGAARERAAGRSQELVETLGRLHLELLRSASQD